MAVGDVAIASWEPDSGFVDASLATSTLAIRATSEGATIAQRIGVTEILTERHCVTGVRTEAGVIRAPIVVNCAGVWADRRLAPLGIDVPLAPTRHQVSFFVRPTPFRSHPAIADLTNNMYMRPDLGNLTIFGLLEYGEIVSPDDFNEGIDPGEIMGNAERIARRFPIMVDGLSRGGYSGLYDITPDHEPVLGAIPEYSVLIRLSHSPRTTSALPVPFSECSQLAHWWHILWRLSGSLDGRIRELGSDGRWRAYF
jgi:sarcosine oxidase subunit beta